MNKIVLMMLLAFVSNISIAGNFDLLKQYTDTMQPGQWIEIPNSLAPLHSREELKAIQTKRGGLAIDGVSGSSAVFAAWTGSAFDGKRWWFFGGGHRGYGGNGVYEFDLTTLKWERLFEPSPLTGPNRSSKREEQDCPSPADGPSSTHTYDGFTWNPIAKSVWLLRSGKGYCKVGIYSETADEQRFWSFDPDTKQWTANPVKGEYRAGYTMSEWNPVSKTMFVVPKLSGGGSVYPIELNETFNFVRRGKRNFGVITGNMSYNSNDKAMYYLTKDQIRKLSPNDTEELLGSEAVADLPQIIIDKKPKEGGAIYHPLTNSFIYWNGGRETWSYNIGTKQFKQFTNSEVFPNGSNNRIFDKWVYISELDVFAGVVDKSNGVWLYKLGGENIALNSPIDPTPIDPTPIDPTPPVNLMPFDIFMMDIKDAFYKALDSAECPVCSICKKCEEPPPIIEPPPPTTTSKFFRYAEMPDVVFVEGYADKEEMGIYMLNPNNLYPLGMPKINNWKPNLKSKLITEGVLPTSISFNADTGIITYDGAISRKFMSTAMGHYEGMFIKAHFEQKDTGQKSEPFTISLVVPDVVWDGTEGDFSDAVSLLPKTGHGVMLIKAGNYNKTKINELAPDAITGELRYNSWVGSAQGKEKLYFIGEPGPKPKLNHGEVKGRFKILTKDTNQYIYYKNLDIENGALGAAKYAVYNDLFMHGYSGDAITAAHTDNLYLSNLEMTKMGSYGIYHGIYLHNITKAHDGIMRTNTYTNNFKAYEMISPTMKTGGISFKALSDNLKIRNFWVSQWPDPEKPGIGGHSGSNPINFTSFAKVVMFNGEMWTNGRAILMGRRLPSGDTNPMYFEEYGVGIYPLTESSRAKSIVYHGGNANHTYSKTGLEADLEPNPNWTPINAPFWDSIGDVTDPTNDKLTMHKYFSFITFHTEGLPEEIEGKAPFNIAIDIRGTMPRVAPQQFDPFSDSLPTPPNWKERNHVFIANNTFHGYVPSANPNWPTQWKYRTDFTGPTRYAYPHSPDYKKPQKITNIGGDITDGEGNHVTLPKWFKI